MLGQFVVKKKARNLVTALQIKIVIFHYTIASLLHNSKRNIGYRAYVDNIMF